MNFGKGKQYYEIYRSDGYESSDHRRYRRQYFWGGVDASRYMAGNKLQLSLSDYVTSLDYKETAAATGQRVSFSRTFSNTASATLQYYPTNRFSVGVTGGAGVFREKSSGFTDTYVTPYVGAMFNGSPSDNIFMNFNYLAKSSHPSLNSLSDHGYFSDSLVYRIGNPALNPSLVHSFMLTASLWRKVTVMASYSYTHDASFEYYTPGFGPLQSGIEAPYVSFAGLSPMIISLACDMTVNNVYAKRKRFKERLAEINTDDAIAISDALDNYRLTGQSNAN